MGRPSNTQQRRSQITKALMEVMASRGYDGASVAEIAKAAHLTPGVVHYHFTNKQEILLSALGELVTRHDERLAARIHEVDEDPIGELDVFIDFHLGLGADTDAAALACWVLLSGEALRNTTVRLELERALKAMTAEVGQIIRRGVSCDVFECNDVDAAASALVAVIQGYFVLAATARSVIPKGSAARSARRMADGLLCPARSLAGGEESR